MNGPFGGTVNALATSGSSVFAATACGIFRSADQGVSWTMASNGIPVSIVGYTSTLAVSGGSVFVGCYYWIYRSTDDGTTWTLQQNGIPAGTYISTLASRGTALFAGTNHGVYRSIDNGSNWMQAGSGLPAEASISKIVFCDSATIVTTYSHGLFYLIDNDAAWHPLTLAGTKIREIRASVTFGGNTLIGTYNQSEIGGIYRLMRHDTTFTAVRITDYSGNTANVFVISGSTLFAGSVTGIYRSDDNGVNWIRCGTGMPSLYQASSLVVSGTSLITASYTSRPVFRSMDRGDHWSESHAGLTGYVIRKMAASETQLFTGTDGGLYASALNDSSWHNIDYGDGNTQVSALIASNQKVYVGSFCVYLSSDNGLTWKMSRQGLPSATLTALTTSGSNLYAGCYGGVYLSSDNGGSWHPINTGLPTTTWCYVVGAVGSTLITGTSSTQGMYRSVDNGATWVAANTGLPASCSPTALAITDSTVYLGNYYGGVYNSIDQGVTWKSIGLNNRSVKSIVCNGSQLFAATDNGLMTTTDRGRTWEAIEAGLPMSDFTTVTVGGTRLYAGTRAGVWMRPLFDVTRVALGTPVDSALGVSTTCSFSWAPMAGALTYTLQVSAVSDFSTLIAQRDGLVSASYELGGLSHQKTYYWRVRAVGSNGTSLWSQTQRFTTEVPGPTLLSPVNGTRHVPIDPALSWNAFPGAVSYRLQVSVTENFSSTIVDRSGIKETSYQASGLTRYTKYYWRVKAMIEGEATAWSAVQAFVTIVPPPEVVKLATPSDGIRIGTSDVRFTWLRAEPEVTLYEIELEGDSTIVRETADTTIVLPVLPSAHEKTLLWRVRAKNLAGTGQYSSAWSFVRLVTAVDQFPALPVEMALHNNYPNPFNPTTTFSFAVPAKQYVSLNIYDLFGKLVAVIAAGDFLPGVYTRQWDASGIPSGIYFYRLQAGAWTNTKRLLLLK
ncbi:MAG TPA: T9SS type A sorting domain-containing protein [Bacteroidota bacterium]|nr:T9SS type A sorting domain-containing protein [Bacteroidota bacterium]